MALTQADVLGEYGRVGRDGTRVHQPVSYRETMTFALRSTGGVVRICSAPEGAVLTHAAASVAVAHNGTAPTVTVGIFGSSAGTADDPDALIDNADIDLTSTGYTAVTDKLGLIDPGSCVIAATFAATAAPTAGEVTISLEFTASDRPLVTV